MVKFFLFFYSVSLYCAANTGIVAEAESEGFTNVTPWSTSAYAETTNEHEHPTETTPHNTKGPPTTENCNNKPETNIGALNCSLPNESATCVMPCPPLRTCRNRKERYHCPLIALNSTCSYNCSCNDGFYHNDDGFCVTSDLCDKKCARPNEEYKADKKSCPLELCPSKISVIRYACNPKELGQPGCVCKTGFRRLSFNSTCIPLDQCPGQGNQPPTCSLPNESAKCVKICPPPKTCENRKVLYRCVDNTNETCKLQCVCDDGFFRNSDGFCVTNNLCDKKCPCPNEEYKADKMKCPPEICRSIVSRYACDPKEIGQPGCVCKSGFLRLNLNSSCIPTRECPELANQPPECNLPNESLKCITSCPRPRTCATRNIRYKCPNNTNETCKLGYKKCPGPNEEYKPDKKTCPLETCPSRFGVIRYACNPNEVGRPGCACKPGFRRLAFNSTCIPIEQCPGQGNQNGNCRDDEIFNKCPSEDCEYCPTCDAEARKCAGPSSTNCPPAKCTCRYNYKRLSNGTCVPARNCPPFKCSHPNEQFDSCPLCPSDDCERATPSGDCPRIGRIGIPLLCRPSCRCEKNYWRNGDRCVPYTDCPNIKKMLQCNQPNEVWKCVKSYPPQRTCKNRGMEENCFNNRTEICKYDCVCNDGFYRNDDGYCVTSELCDKNCPRPNEIYKGDKKKCPPQTCESILALYKCDSKEKAQPGCVCKPGYLRLNTNSTCISTSECPHSPKPTDKCLLE